MSKIPPAEERFYGNLKGFFDLTKDILDDLYTSKKYTEIPPALVDIAWGFLCNSDKVQLLENFIKKSHPHWEKIREKDQDFFVSNASCIFGELPTDKLNSFLKLLTTDMIGEEQKKNIWNYLSSFVKISIKYLYEKRGGKMLNDTYTFDKEFFVDVPDLNNSIKNWDIKF